MDLESEIVIVSGLPRSGTSLLMQMLHAGGIEVVSDHLRTADVDNPRGYFELEKVKQIQKDASWIPGTRGKAFKMVSQLLYHLPHTERYRVIFMQRNLDEVLASQEKMLRRRQSPVAPRETIREAFTLHLDMLHRWLQQQANIQLLQVNYNELVTAPAPHAENIARFLGNRPAVPAMLQAIDTDLYRNRNAGARA